METPKDKLSKPFFPEVTKDFSISRFGKQNVHANKNILSIEFKRILTKIGVSKDGSQSQRNQPLGTSLPKLKKSKKPLMVALCTTSSDGTNKPEIDPDEIDVTKIE